MEATRILNGVPSRCLSFGCGPQDPITTNSEYLILVVPGNPGLIEFYRDFMSELFLRLRVEFPLQNVPVVGISHGGHQTDGIESSFPKLNENLHLYDLKGQTTGKLEFIKSLPKNVKIIMIGHSIGCKMLLDVLKQLPEDIQSRVLKCYMLFPTIERMRDTPNGRILWPLFPYASVLYCILFPLMMLPRPIQRFLLLLYFFFRSPSPSIMSASLQLVSKDVFNRTRALAQDELTNVYDLDEDGVRKYIHKLYFYFGTTDKWCPLDFAYGMADKFPSLDYQICTRGYEHAFVVQSSQGMAEVLIPLFTQDIQASAASSSTSAKFKE